MSRESPQLTGSRAEETAELERIEDSLKLNVIRFWEKEMK